MRRYPYEGAVAAEIVERHFAPQRLEAAHRFRHADVAEEAKRSVISKQSTCGGKPLFFTKVSTKLTN